jgi:predicted metal-dependent peptidase
MERWAKERLKPVVNWKSLLRRAIRRGYLDLREQQYPTYQRQNRRGGAYRPVMMPGGYNLIPKVAVVVDTSGSVDDGMLGQALAEVRAITRGLGSVTLYSVDAEVNHVQKVFGGAEVRLFGGGGTNMGVGIERAAQDGHRMVVVLTDGYTPWPDRSPKGVKVVAGIIGDGPAPEVSWIQTVRIKD